MLIKREKTERVLPFVILTAPWKETECHIGPLRRSTRVGQQAEGERVVVGKCLYFGFLGKDWGEAR